MSHTYSVSTQSDTVTVAAIPGGGASITVKDQAGTATATINDYDLRKLTTALGLFVEPLKLTPGDN